MRHTNSVFLQRGLAWVLTAVLALALSGCSSETSERKAFITFLQTRIIDKPGVHVPKLTQDEEKSFGDYSKHFAVITDFTNSMNTRVSGPMKDMMGKGMPRTMPELLARREDLARIRQTAALLRTNIDTELAKANAQRMALKQPEDLKQVYDKAYARTVSGPATMVREFLPAVENTLEGADKLAAFLDAHKGEIKFRGSMLEVTDPKLLAETNTLIAQMSAQSNEVMNAQRKMNTLVSGR